MEKEFDAFIAKVKAQKINNSALDKVIAKLKKAKEFNTVAINMNNREIEEKKRNEAENK